jgi:hypothetical protein
MAAGEPTDAAAAADVDEPEAESEPLITELLGELGRDVGVLAFLETQLALSRNMPEVRRAARDIAGALVALLAFLTAFAFGNVAAFIALSDVMPTWLAALVLAAVWIAVGAVIVVALMVRAGRVTGWSWWRVFSAGPQEAERDLQRARDEAARAVRETLERVAPAMTVEIASAAMPLAGDMASEVVDAGEDILEASDQFVEALADDLPGGGVVNQVWDVVLMPGRLGLRVATTVLKRGSE